MWVDNLISKRIYSRWICPIRGKCPVQWTVGTAHLRCSSSCPSASRLSPRTAPAPGVGCDGPWGRSMSTVRCERGGRRPGGVGVTGKILLWRQGRGASPPRTYRCSSSLRSHSLSAPPPKGDTPSEAVFGLSDERCQHGRGKPLTVHVRHPCNPLPVLHVLSSQPHQTAYIAGPPTLP